MHVGYFRIGNKLVWKGWTVPLDTGWLFDEKDCRFVPKLELQAEAQEKIRQEEWRTEREVIITRQGKLLDKLLVFLKVDSLDNIPFIFHNPEVFPHAHYANSTASYLSYLRHSNQRYDKHLLDVSFFVQYVRRKFKGDHIIIDGDELRDFLGEYGFADTWHEIESTVNELQEFMDRLTAAGVVKKSGDYWEKTGDLKYSYF